MGERGACRELTSLAPLWRPHKTDLCLTLYFPFRPPFCLKRFVLASYASQHAAPSLAKGFPARKGDLETQGWALPLTEEQILEA